MFNRMFNHVNLMEKSLDALWLRQEVISNNIANADTPDYKSQHVEFETAFRQALESENSFTMKTTRDRHITVSHTDALSVRPSVVTETWHSIRMDGNNVDPDAEMTELAANTIQYNTTIQLVNAELMRLKTAITGT